MYFNVISYKKLCHILVLFSFILLPFYSYTQNIPYLGNSADQLWGKSEEKNIGRSAYNLLLSEGNIVTDLNNQDYLDYLGYKIATYTNTRVGLHFFLTKSTTINAFAGIGGYIGINAGLVLATDNEHELAGVIAHEITHVSQEHIPRTILAINDRQIANIAAAAASILIATQSSSDVGMGLFSGIIANETQQQLDDIRSHEVEADRVGRKLMEKANYSEIAMQTFFGKLFTPDYAKKIPSYLLTHPLPQDRQADIDKLNKKSKTLKSSDEFYLFKSRLQVKLLQKKEVEKIIQKNKKSKNNQFISASLYTQSLLNLKYSKIKTAKSNLNSISKYSSRFANKRDVVLLKAKLELLDNNISSAQKIYKKLWEKYKNDSVVAYDYASFLNTRHSYTKAEKILNNLIKNGTNNQKIYHLYGSILNKLGLHAKKQEILIEAYLLSGNYHKAQAQVKISLNNPNMDWKARSKLEARQIEIERILQSIKDNK